jgi:hypothetical protein
MNRFLICLFTVSLLSAEEEAEILVSIESETEVINVAPGDSIVALQNRFVVEGSVKLEGAPISFDLAGIEGTLKLHDPLQESLWLTVTYDYLKGDFPAFVASSGSFQDRSASRPGPAC